METHTISEFIYFGLGWRYLQDARQGMPLEGDSNILNNYERLFKNMDDFGLVVTKRAAKELIDHYEDLKKRDKPAVLTQTDANKLKKGLTVLQKTLRAESFSHVAFITTEKRIDVTKLITDVNALFPPNIFDSMPGIAKYDFSEAGKCIAFERPTAAAFHILRGTEDVLRDFYCSIVKRDRVDPFLWGPMVSHLRERKKSPPEVLLENLDNIRRSFRNPTQHPEKIYDIQEVQDLFALCVDVIGRMIKLRQSKPMVAV